MPDAIEVRELTKYYGKNRGVESLSFAVPNGQAYGFLGPNGAGKTTTIRCLLGMLKASSGEAYVLGERAGTDGARIRRRIGYVAGEVHLYERETGDWLLDYVTGFRGGHEPSRVELIERLEVDTRRRIRELSKGNRQKLALVVGLMHDPELLVLDEPTSGLDPLNQQTVYDILEERMSGGATVFLSSHILPEVERVCARVAIIREGRLVAEEDVAALGAKRLREVTVSFAEPVPAEDIASVPGVVEVEQVGPLTLRAKVRAEIDPLVKRLAAEHVTELEVEHATLEDVFMEYYRGGEGR